MTKSDLLLEKVGSIPVKYPKILKNLKKFAKLEGEEKLACANNILNDFEMQKEAFLPALGAGLKAFGKGFMPLLQSAGRGAKNLKGLWSNPHMAKYLRSGASGMSRQHALNTARNMSTWKRMGTLGRGAMSNVGQWGMTNPGQAAALAGAGGYGLGKMSSEKTADWKKLLAAGAVGSIPVGILAAVGYKNLKDDMKQMDAKNLQTQQQMQDELSSVGAAADLYGLNQLFGPGGNIPDGTGPYGAGMGPGGGAADGSGMESWDQMYNSYNPQDFQYKAAMLEDDKFMEKLEKIGAHTRTRNVLIEQLDNAELSKEAKDLAIELLEENKLQLVGSLHNLLLG